MTEESEKKILLARKDNKIVGFCILHEEETGMDWELSAVSDKCRGYGIYKLMASELIRYANKRNKFFYSSTQLDNYISQRTWASLGMKPFIQFTIFIMICDKMRMKGQECQQLRLVIGSKK